MLGAAHHQAFDDAQNTDDEHYNQQRQTPPDHRKVVG